VLKRIVAVAFAGLMALAVMAPSALAEGKVCRGTIGARTLDNVRVPQDASCGTLKGTRVQGMVKVQNGARLIANGVSSATSRARARDRKRLPPNGEPEALGGTYCPR